MKKIAIIFGFLAIGAVMFSSCRSQKQACAAYSQVEMPDTDQSNS